MPVYSFFTLHGGKQIHEAEVELANADAAWEEAVSTCAQALKELNGGFKPSENWTIRVHEADGGSLFELKLAGTDFRKCAEPQATGNNR